MYFCTKSHWSRAAAFACEAPTTITWCCWIQWNTGLVEWSGVFICFCAVGKETHAGQIVENRSNSNLELFRQKPLLSRSKCHWLMSHHSNSSSIWISFVDPKLAQIFLNGCRTITRIKAIVLVLKSSWWNPPNWFLSHLNSSSTHLWTGIRWSTKRCTSFWLNLSTRSVYSILRVSCAYCHGLHKLFQLFNL